MANCVKCGTPLREGAKFCGACGAKVEAQRFCTECGAELKSGEHFCTQCGTPAEGTPVPKRRGRPPKNAAAPSAPSPKTANSKQPDYPDVRGFYGGRKAVSASDEALVWSDGMGIYRLERDWSLRCSKELRCDTVIQTKEAILALDIDYGNDSRRMILITLDKDLRELSRKVLCEIPAEDAIEECDYYMTQFDLFVLQYTIVNDTALKQDIFSDISLRQIDLITGETREWKWERLELGGWTADRVEFAAVDGEQVYLTMDLYKGEDDASAVMIFDPNTASFSPLWQGSDRSDNDGRPLFFDWDRHIMWTPPTKAEQERRGLSNKALVGRKIAPNAPILSNLTVWQEFHSGNYLTYFDGTHAYYAPCYFEFFGYGESGSQSEDWNHSGHGRAETAMVWPQADKIVMDLRADYWYTVYPLSVAKPSREELIPLRKQE